MPPTLNNRTSMMSQLHLTILLLTLLLTTATATFTAMTYINPQKSRVWFRFTLSPGKFRPNNRIMLKLDDQASWEKDFIPISTPDCLFVKLTDSDAYYLSIGMSDTTADVSTFEQFCTGEFAAVVPINVVLSYMDGSEADWQTFTTTLAPLHTLTAANPPTFTPYLMLTPESTPNPTPDPMIMNTQQDDPVPPPTPNPNEFGNPWEPGFLSFELTFDHELPITRQAYLLLNNVPYIESCSYNVTAAPILPTPNVSRITTIVSSTPVDPTLESPTSGLYNIILDLIHLPYFTRRVDETKTAIYSFDDDDDSNDGSAIPAGWTASLVFLCKSSLPSQTILTQDPIVPYTIQLSGTKDFSDPELAKYSMITVPLEQQPIKLTQGFEDLTILKLLPASLTLPDSCQITTEIPSPTCNLQIKLGLDTTETYPIQHNHLVIPVGSRIQLQFDPHIPLFSDISLCSLSTRFSFKPSTQTIILTTTDQITLSRDPVSTSTIECASSLTGRFPPSQKLPNAILAVTRPPTATETSITYAPLGLTSNSLKSALTSPLFQTLVVSVTVQRPHYSLLQSSWSSDAPFLAQEVQEWGQETLASTSNFQEPTNKLILADMFWETGTTRNDIDKVTVKLGYYGALPNIQRLIPVFYQNATTDTLAGLALKAQLEKIYVEAGSNVEVVANTTFYQAASVNSQLDWTESDRDCGGGKPATNRYDIGSPRCSTDSFCRYDSDCRIGCSSTIDFYRPMVSNNDNVNDIKALTAVEIKQIVRRRVYVDGLCLSAASGTPLTMVVIAVIVSIIMILA